MYICNDCYKNNKFEKEAYMNEHKLITLDELKKLNLPLNFPRTDKLWKKKNLK